MADIYVGIDLGGTNVKVGCFDEKLDVLNKASVPTPCDAEPDAVIDKIVEAVNLALAGIPAEMKDVTALGIGAPGPSNISAGVIVAAPNMPKIKNFPIRDILSKRFGKPVAFENDANAACWGEFAAGAGKDVNDMAFFTLGTGIGGGLVCNGQIVHGYDDNAAEFGHIIVEPGGRLCGCGQKGCVEPYASASSTALRAQEAVESGAESSLKKVLDENGEITCKDVYEHLAAGDKLAKEITDKTAEMLALLCVNMIHISGPSRIVFAGGMIAAGDLLLDRMKYYFDEHIWPLKKETVEVCFATLGEDAGIIGAAGLAVEIFGKG
jgi:glucokinase